MRSDVADYDLIIVNQTTRAVLVKDEEGGTPVWLPLSQVELEHEDGGRCVATIPDWLAIEKGLI